MKPIEPPLCNIALGKDQKEYRTLPAYARKDVQGVIITCWELDEEEKEIFAKTGKIYLSTFTLMQTFQPILPSVRQEEVYSEQELKKDKLNQQRGN